MNNWTPTDIARPKLYSVVEVSSNGLTSDGELEYTNRAECAGWYGRFETGFAYSSGCLYGYLVDEQPKYWRYKY